MNKLFTKIATACVGLAMAVGVGVAVGNNSAFRANATNPTSPITFDWDAGTTMPSVPNRSSSAFTNNGGTKFANNRFKLDTTNDNVVNKNIFDADTVLTSLSVTIWGAENTTTTNNDTLTVSAVNSSGTVITGLSVSQKVKFPSATMNSDSTVDSRTLVDSCKTVYNFDAQTLSSASTVRGIKINLDNKTSNYVLRRATVTFTVYVAPTKTLTSLSITGSPTKLSYYDTESFDATGITKYQAVYDDESTKDLTASDITWPTLTAGDETIKGSYTEGGVTVYTPTYNITVAADSLSSVVVSGTMSKTTYTTNDSWSSTGLVVTAVYASTKQTPVTASATFKYYSDSAMTIEKATPFAFGAGTNKTLYIKATYSEVSNTAAYSQTVTVTEAPVETEITFDLSATTQVTTNSTDSVVFTEGIVTLTIDKEDATTNANNYLGQGDDGTRVYANSIITVSVNGSQTYLKTVVFNKTVNNKNLVTGIGTSNWTGGTAASATGKITVTASSNTQTVSHTVAAKADIGSVAVTYTAPYQAVTGISLNKNSITMTSYDEERIIASALPANATVGGVTFGGYDEEIISVDASGYITPTGTKFGQTTVTITSKGNKSDSTKATATCTVTITRASFKEAKYTYSSSSVVTPSGDLIAGSTATYSSEGAKFGTTDHLTDSAGKGEATLTISKMAGYIVKAVVIKLHSEADTGSASFSVVAGSTTLKSISASAFDSASWYGSYSSENVLMRINMSTDDYVIQESENVVLTFSTTVSGFYITDYRIRYIKAGLPEEAVTFANKVLTELACNSAGTSAPSVDEWEALRTYYLNDTNVPTESKTVLFEAAPSDHDYDPLTDITEAQILAAAMAKYDYVIAKYGRLEDGNGQKIYKDFINRNPAPLPGLRVEGFSTINSDAATTPIIAIVSLIGVTAIGGYFFLRKKKHQ